MSTTPTNRRQSCDAEPHENVRQKRRSKRCYAVNGPRAIDAAYRYGAANGFDM